MIRIETALIRSGETVWSGTENLPLADQIVFSPLDTTGLESIRSGHSVRANSCIYCGSTSGLTREHIIPHGLGGTATIGNGSCQTCQKITSKFENSILGGELQQLRYRLGMPSRSKHKRAKELKHRPGPPISVFPVFPLPDYQELTGAKGMKLEKFLISGRDYDGLLKNGHDQELLPVQFARMIAKIAYGFAWSTKLLEYVSGYAGLVDAFMHNPHRLSKYVGTAPPPYRRSDTPGHNLRTGGNPAYGVACVFVHLLAHMGTPTYIVAIGDLRKSSE